MIQLPKFVDAALLLFRSSITAFATLNIRLSDQLIQQLGQILENKNLLDVHRKSLLDVISASAIAEDVNAVLSGKRKRPPVKEVFLDDFSPSESELADTEQKPPSKLAKLYQELMSTEPPSNEGQSTKLEPLRQPLQPEAHISSESEMEPENPGDDSAMGMLLMDCVKPMTDADMKSSITQKGSRKTQMLDLAAINNRTTKSEKQEHKEEHRRRMPNIDKLHLQVLSWSHLSVRSPHLELSKHTRSIPDVFTSIEDYQAVFEPLLLSECRAQILRSMDELQFDRYCQMTLVSVATVDSFTEVSFRFTKESELNFMENDLLIVLPWQEQFSLEEILTSEPSKNPDDQLPVLFAKVQSIVNKKNDLSIVTRFNLQSSKKHFMLMRKETMWMVVPLTSLITINREFQSLYGLEHYVLKNEILDPLNHQSWKGINAPKNLIDSCEEAFRLNRSQAEAVGAVMRQKTGFILIQGPPGTVRP
jgi:hypothetical protein